MKSAIILSLTLLICILNATARNVSAASLDGRWYLTFDLPEDIYRAAVAFKTEADGTVKAAILGEPNLYLTGGTLTGNELKLNGKSGFGDVVITAQIDADKITGKWSVGFVGGVMSGEREPADKAKTDYTQVFEKTWKTVNDKFYDPRFNGIDWKAAGEKYRPTIEKAANDAEFMNAMRAMLKELKVSHVGFYYSPFEREMTPKNSLSQDRPALQSIT